MKQEDIMKLEAAIAADYSNIAGMVVRKDGETVYERYFGGCTAKSRLNVFSVTKSIVSILLGQLYLDGGIWNGQRLVSERWVRESTAEQSRWAERDLPSGYLWWVLPQGHGFAAMGDGGNALYVSPDKNLVAAITSRFQPRVKDRIELIRTYVSPCFD